MNKVEAVARAISDEHHRQGYDVVIPGDLQDAFARAAIKAMRSTTEAMENAPCVKAHLCSVGTFTARLTYQAMIDTALEEAENEAFWNKRDDDVFGPDNV